MKKLLVFSLVSSSFIFNIQQSKADWDHWATKNNVDFENMTNTIEIYKYNSITNKATLQTSIFLPTDEGGNYSTASSFTNGSFVDNQNNIYLKIGSQFKKYNYQNNSWSNSSHTDWKDNYASTTKVDGSFIKGDSLITLTEEGLNINGSGLITQKNDGSVHIGQNSAIFKEEDGREKFWAQDANGKSIPIDITNGSKLLINGRDVEQSINNVGALSAALTGLPTVPTDTNLACGIGSGTYAGDFAFSGGCASKLNKNLAINYAASLTLPSESDVGYSDTFSARAGFVWKLGKATKPTQISMKETKELKEEIADLKENNKNIIAQNNALLARLERLEKVALGEHKSKDLAVYKLQ